MELNDLSRLTDAQDKGHEFEFRDPVHGNPTGLKITITGPDSKTTKKASAEVQRFLSRFRGGDVPAQERVRIMDDFFFAVTLGWDIKEAGRAVPFNRQNFQRLIDAGTWVRGQIDLFAGDRSPYFKAAD